MQKDQLPGAAKNRNSITLIAQKYRDQNELQSAHNKLKTKAGGGSSLSVASLKKGPDF